jgi:two-component system, OmpR family, response regulator
MAEKHILAVDDDPTTRELIADYLTNHGFRVSTAASGQEVARIIDENIVDLMILDLQLAEEDGLQLVNELRMRSNLPIIVIPATGVTRSIASSALSLGRMII